MTREEALEFIAQSVKSDVDMAKVANALKALEQEPTYTSQIAQKAYEDGKKDGYVQAKLEQEPILDKLRVEIEQNAYPIVYGINNHELGMTLYGILQVIDKYKGESENK